MVPYDSRAKVCCAVPKCHSSNIKSQPRKMFFHVPSNTEIRKKWLQLAGKNNIDATKNYFFCEDHFDLPNDMSNYTQYCVNGHVHKPYTKTGCLPSKFDCQKQSPDQPDIPATSPLVSQKVQEPLNPECVSGLQGRNDSRDKTITSSPSKSGARSAEENLPTIVEIPVITMKTETNWLDIQIENSGTRECAVPLCSNNDGSTPHKCYIAVPSNAEWRTKWLDLAQCDDLTRSKTSLYFCEDHFDMPNDMQNYKEYRDKGSTVRVSMRHGCLPSKFLIPQKCKKRRLSPSITQTHAIKKETLLEEDPLSLEDVTPRISVLNDSHCVNETLKTRKNHWCIVPQCPNHDETKPKKLFISVPSNPDTRKKWMELARVKETALVTPMPHIIYFCEDHFDLENDMVLHEKNGKVNYTRMKTGCLPSKFDCQERNVKIIYPRIRQTVDVKMERALEEDSIISEFVNVIGTEESVINSQDVFKEEYSPDDLSDDDGDDVMLISKKEESQSSEDNLENESSMESMVSIETKIDVTNDVKIEIQPIMSIEQTISTDDETLVKQEKIEEDYSY